MIHRVFVRLLVIAAMFAFSVDCLSAEETALSPQLFKVPMRNGVNLATDVYLPESDGPFPVLIKRTPYSRKTDNFYVDKLVESGYAFVLQDCRGKFDSEGTFVPLIDEANDGRDTIEWVAKQPWCNGSIGLIGHSYRGMVQIPAAAGQHKDLKCIIPGVSPASFFNDWLRYDGCFALAGCLNFAYTHSAGRLPGNIDRSKVPAIAAATNLDQVFAVMGAESPILKDWVTHDTYDDYWKALDQTRMYDKISVPGLHVGGWFDYLSRGAFSSYTGIRDRGASPLARKNQRLLIGPWGHNPRGHKFGDWDFGPDADLHVFEYQKRFSDLWMRRMDDGISKEPPVKLFIMGTNRWASFADWPPPQTKTQTWRLTSSGRANTGAGDGKLALDLIPGPPDNYTYDPKNPVPTLGGPVNMPGAEGPRDQAPILSRKDVLCYKSDPLDKPLTVIGPINLDLCISSDAEDTDFVAKFCVITPDPNSKMYPLTVGSLRCRYRDGFDKVTPLTPGKPTPIRIQLGNTAYTFPKGSSIALLLTSSSFPRILPHPNTIAPTWTEPNPRPANQTIYHDKDHNSRIHLPVVDI